jgi:hypothetical protein
MKFTLTILVILISNFIGLASAAPYGKISFECPRVAVTTIGDNFIGSNNGFTLGNDGSYQLEKTYAFQISPNFPIYGITRLRCSASNLNIYGTNVAYIDVPNVSNCTKNGSTFTCFKGQSISTPVVKPIQNDPSKDYNCVMIADGNFWGATNQRDAQSCAEHCKFNFINHPAAKGVNLFECKFNGITQIELVQTIP